MDGVFFGLNSLKIGSILQTLFYINCFRYLEKSVVFNRIRQKSPILYRWVMNAVRYEGYRW
ncbi:hypothetical protein CYQ77_13190 [Enterococcus faecium]|uniref:Transposase n=1 Tax=Enterococcus faecium TaxID=1352 RepID=A0AB37VQ57_ENTFC|nr:hypothetical protein CYQ77_13190 [Enterococcus faecium]